MKISLNCSSFVAQQYGYRPGDDWGVRVAAVNAYYAPLATFGHRFEALGLEVIGLGYQALDIWTPGQLSWAWATTAHIEAAAAVLKRHNLAVTSLGGAFGATREAFRSACSLAVGVGTSLLSGTVPLLANDRTFVTETLAQFDLRLAIENHPEKSVDAMLEQIGDGGDGRLGTAVDTGWYATQGVDPVTAIETLGEHVYHIHLKDIRAAGEHVNCGFTQGIVSLEECVRALKDIGYRGDISVENHCFDHDPRTELVEARSMLEGWLEA